MAFLLDTHVLLWWLAEPERLSPVVRATLADSDQPVFISAASAWEIATNHRLGPFPLSKPVVKPVAMGSARLAYTGKTAAEGQLWMRCSRCRRRGSW